MLDNHTLLIDRDCPMCKLYGKGFVRHKLIAPNVVEHYQDNPKGILQEIDGERAKSEIALHNLLEGSTRYGIDAFLAILQEKFPRTVQFLRKPIPYFLSKKLYRFISYNRKVIAPPIKGHSTCSPPFHLVYRVLYLLVGACTTAAILSVYLQNIYPYLGLKSGFALEWLICGGQILWQGAVVALIAPYKRADYLGHMTTISLLGAGLLLPPLGICYLIGLGPIYLIIAFGLVVAIMFVEHLNRCKALGLSKKLNISWLVYRILILVTLFTLSL